MTTRQTGLILVLTAAIAWSMAGLFTRLLPLDAATVLFWRGLFGAIGTAALMAVLPRGPARLGVPGLAYAGVTGASMLFFVAALLTTSVAHVAIITATVPLVAAALGWAVLREAPGASAVAAALAALTGVAVMVGLGHDGRLAGDALAGLMALCMGGMILLSRRFPGIPALPATALASGLSALVALPFATLAITPGQGAILLAFALVTQVLGFGAFALGARYLPPMDSALIVALDAPLAPLWVWLVFAETPSQTTLAGGTLVIGAVVLHIRHSARRPP
jgi:drug/metabolite transporter (DMT)-like permease